MSDRLISLKAAIETAIDAVDDWDGGMNSERAKIIGKALLDLPSAQPEEDCNTCKHGYFGDAQCERCRVRYPSHYERRKDDK